MKVGLQEVPNFIYNLQIKMEKKYLVFLSKITLNQNLIRKFVFKYVSI